jgi:serine/threonine-protein kinase
MNMQLRNTTAAAALLLAAGCASGGTSSAPVTSLPAAPSSSPSAAAGTALLTISFKIPSVAKPAAKAARKPQYISPSTSSVTVGVDSATATTATSNCASGTCTVTVDLTPGAHTLAIRLYDALNGTGNELASNTAAPCTVTLSQANSCPVTMYGLAKKIGVTSQSYDLAGSQAGGGYTYINGSTVNPFTIVALDADGNQILGVGGIAPSIASPPSGITVATPAPSASPIFTITDTNPAAQNVSISATPAPNSDGSTVSASLSFTGAAPLSSASPHVYVANATSSFVLTYAANGAQTTLGSALTPFTGLSDPAGLAVDSSGNIYVANENTGGTGNLSVYPPSGGSPTYTITSGLKNPDGLAVVNGKIYVGDYGTNSVAVFNAADGSPAPLANAIAANVPDGVAVDATSGDIYVSNYGSNTVSAYDPTGAPLSLANPISVTGPAGLAIANGALFVTSFSGGTVTVYNDATGAAAPLANPIGGLTNPAGVAVDASGNIYVSSFGAGAVTEWDSTGALVTLANPITGLYNPVGVAVH